MLETKQTTYVPSQSDLIAPALFTFGFTFLFVSWIAEKLTPSGYYPYMIGVAAGFVACRKVLGNFHPIISGLAALSLAGLFYLDRYPSEKSCQTMAFEVSYVEEQQAKAADYWAICFNPSSDDQDWCSDFKPERTTESLRAELDYLSDRIAKRCRD